MKKKLIGVWNYHEVINNRKGFLSDNPGYYLGESSMKAFYNVYKNLEKKNIEIKILYEIENFDDIDLLIFINYPKIDNKYVKKAMKLEIPKYLMMYEGPTIYPEMWDIHKHREFKKIFTWHDEFIDGKKYFKINLPSYDLPIKINPNIKNRNKFCITMGSNKKSKHKLDLYRKRLEAIEWFEKNYPNSLDFYGYGWNKYVFSGPKIIRALNRINFITKFFAKYKNYKTYKGEYHGFKKSLYEKYKFSICFENAKDIPGWLTEKIFHCFFSGCIPIYYGANNISDHIPKNCFIDFRDFNNYDDLYSFLLSITDIQIYTYIQNIQEFINSKNFYNFTHEYFTKTVTTEIQLELSK